MGSTVTWQILPAGEAAILVHVDDVDEESRWRSALWLRRRILADPFHGFTDLISSYEDVLIQFDPNRTEPSAVTTWLRPLLPATVPPIELGQSRTFVIPAIIDSTHAPDLENVAQELNWSTERLVAEMLADRFVIRLLGAGMEPMCSAPFLPAPIPRRARPRERVPAGSLALAARSFAIYPFDAPGGWQLVGRTPIALSDPRRDKPTAYQPGDVFRIQEIREEDGHLWADRELCPEES